MKRHAEHTAFSERSNAQKMTGVYLYNKLTDHLRYADRVRARQLVQHVHHGLAQENLLSSETSKKTLVLRYKTRQRAAIIAPLLESSRASHRQQDSDAADNNKLHETCSQEVVGKHAVKACLAHTPEACSSWSEKRRQHERRHEDQTLPR